MDGKVGSGVVAVCVAASVRAPSVIWIWPKRQLDLQWAWWAEQCELASESARREAGDRYRMTVYLLGKLQTKDGFLITEPLSKENRSAKRIVRLKWAFCVKGGLKWQRNRVTVCTSQNCVAADKTSNVWLFEFSLESFGALGKISYVKIFKTLPLPQFSSNFNQTFYGKYGTCTSNREGGGGSGL